MTIQEFISQYKNHPVLFIGTGISLRYLKNSFTWDGLLAKIAEELSGNNEYYLDIKSKHQKDGKVNYSEIAEVLESQFNNRLEEDRNGKFKEINDIFYENMSLGINLSRFKIYISKIFSTLEFKEELEQELKEFKKVRKNVGSIITTNYDGLIETLFEFNKLIGNHILLSNPYGSVYKIHGCYENPEKIIITSQDYSNFNEKYELIRAQLLSLFIHNPIIFIGYSINDENIKKILKTIFTYVEINSDLAKKIRENFLLVEREKGNENSIVTEHDINLDDLIISINKIKTDNFSSIYNSISNLQLPISALDIRRVQSIVKEIYSGGEIKVRITEDLDSLKNEDKVLAIGTSRTIQYHFRTAPELLTNYFEIIDEENSQILDLIDKYIIQTTQYFPIFGFSLINKGIGSADKLKSQQIKNVRKCIESIRDNHKKNHSNIDNLIQDKSIPVSYRTDSIIWNTWEGNTSLNDIKSYLREYTSKTDTSYRKLLSVYDLKCYGNNNIDEHRINKTATLQTS